jgi:hypothetical protein
MFYAIIHLNYLAVLAITVAGFMLGWLWYSPVLFIKPWMAEMKITPEQMKAATQKGVAKFFIRGFLLTLFSTFGLAVLISRFHEIDWLKGLGFGAFVGLFGPVVRMMNNSVWEMRSLKLQAINGGHDIALFALQGALLALWH